MKNKFLSIAAAGLGMGAAAASLALLNKKYVIDPEEKEKASIYMAALDDEICRMELEGKTFNNEELKLPPRQESLYGKVKMFKDANKHLSREELDEKVKILEARYIKARESQNKAEEI